MSCCTYDQSGFRVNTMAPAFFRSAQDVKLLSTENEKSSFVTDIIILDGGLKLIQIYNRQPHP